MKTISAVHVTHEAVRKIGGIGAVLEGLLTATSYQKEIPRTFLVGPLFDNAMDVATALGPDARVLYSSLHRIDEGGWGDLLRPIAEKFNAGIVYGKRLLRNEWNGRSAEAELLLVDIANMRRAPVDKFKWELHKTFGLRSDRYETIWDFEQYVRLALPAFEALEKLVDLTGDNRMVVIAHEFMGVPTALRALLSKNPNTSSVFHAHEVAPVRRIVEEHPAHDTMFYNVLPNARKDGLFLPDVFASQDDFFKNGLVGAAHHCDSVFAVGEFIQQELWFLSESFLRHEIDVVPNGIPCVPNTPEEHETSRKLLCDYAEVLLGWRPTFVLSHVARLVMSKAFWRDVHVLRHLDRSLAQKGETAVFFLLGTEGAQRSGQDILRMEAEYAWPWNHRVGYPDLTGSEIALDRFLQDFNRESRAVKIVFVNQFGWQPSRCGRRMPKEMTFLDLRRGSDVEFGQSIYEPFGISQLEPLTFGALCVPTAICGCVPFAIQQSGGKLPGNILVADYVSPAAQEAPAPSLVNISQAESDRVLEEVSRQLAERVLGALTGLREKKEQFIRDGHALASLMSWEVIAEDFFLPAVQRSFQRAAARPREAAP